MDRTKAWLLTRKQAAEFLGIHPVTLMEWVKKGKLHAVRLPSGRFRFKRRELEALFESRDWSVNAPEEAS